MKILRVFNVLRNDFCADMKCESCGAESELTTGYNDEFYHKEVIPKMKCKECGKSRVEIEGENNGSN